MSAEPESRKLSDLRVVDLKSELEKRGLDKTGNKQALSERLQKALQDEGRDPETYQFDSEKKPTKRLSTSSNQMELDSTNQKDGGDEETEDVDNAEDADVNEQSNHAAKEDVPEPETPAKDNQTEDLDHLRSESPIRLTLDEGESFQDEEMYTTAEVLETSEPKPKEDEGDDEPGNKDTKNSTNKTEEKPAKETPVKSDNNQESQDGKASTNGASKPSRSISQNRNLWITNISQATRATELKQAFSEHGKVIGAKVVVNAKHPGACCFGYVTMSTVEDANNCIAKLDNTELNGQIIHVEKVRPDQIHNFKYHPKFKDEKSDHKNSRNALTGAKESQDRKKEDEKKDSKDATKFKEGERVDDKKDSKSETQKSDSSSSGRRKDSKRKSRTPTRVHSKDRNRSNSKGSRSRHGGEKDVLTFDKIKEERERQRLRERERIIREENRRRREEAARQREVERLQRSEAARLDREREKLRLERERLEREKAEIIRLERERQKLEREKLELEKMELQRVKMRLQEEDRRAIKRPAPYRRETSYEDRKRMPGGERRFDEPTARFDPSKMPKDARFNERERSERSPHFRPIREERERRVIPDHKTAREHRFGEPPKEMQRFERNSGSGNTWAHTSTPSNKMFGASNSSGSLKAWTKDAWRPTDSSNSNDRWNSGSMSRTASLSGGSFSSNSNMNLGPCPPPPTINSYGSGGADRFEYKSMSSLRKY